VHLQFQQYHRVLRTAVLCAAAGFSGPEHAVEAVAQLLEFRRREAVKAIAGLLFADNEVVRRTRVLTRDRLRRIKAQLGRGATAGKQSSDQGWCAPEDLDVPAVGFHAVPARLVGKVATGWRWGLHAATASRRRIGKPGHKPWLVHGEDEHQRRPPSRLAAPWGSLREPSQAAQISASRSCRPGNPGPASSTWGFSSRWGSPRAGQTSTVRSSGSSNQPRRAPLAW